jgi:hypothetical protein
MLNYQRVTIAISTTNQVVRPLVKSQLQRSGALRENTALPHGRMQTLTSSWIATSRATRVLVDQSWIKRWGSDPPKNLGKCWDEALKQAS